MNTYTSSLRTAFLYPREFALDSAGRRSQTPAGSETWSEGCTQTEKSVYSHKPSAQIMHRLTQRSVRECRSNPRRKAECRHTPHLRSQHLREEGAVS